ncbi:efflux transporter outer membrane subunit [Herbaspirillum sp. RTI4]|uniref:efflux transporter outer membrane subunit n=1 Tax=Herbaspirillum sp. RTI4 TaxID=3048640 RepID=UPI002AB54605|nr:efflux transporter outer membrane subunit [Herbaspirillum sp. RTI4]MDY7578885.1 efflux transporter outer membrane subunit [Herbaspirillum sp. RTI4]MEA9981974.1 efflux transporter outer membrane subunit [Herbaspirillum sp. RTI4]
MIYKNTLGLAVMLALGMLASGCAVGPDYKQPSLSPDAAYPAQKTGAGQQTIVSGMDIPAQWWELFQSKQLAAFVNEVLLKNPTLDAAKAALRVAHEASRAQAGAYYPTLAMGIEPSRQRIANTLASPAASGDNLYNLTTAQLSVSFTPDLFGANRRAVESLVAQEEVQRHELEAARLSLAANAVSAAITEAQLRAQIEAAQSVLSIQINIIKSYERQVELGQASQLDMALQQSVLAQAEAALPPLQKQFDANRNLLSALVGRTPGESLSYQFTLDGLILPAELPLSLPARLLEQRPDVLMAEAQLRAANAQIGVAVAARLPNINITASGGNAAVRAADLFSGPTTFWNLAASLTQPIFDGGTLRHKQKGAEAAYDFSAAQYRSTVIGAFQNVGDALHAIESDTAALLAAQRAEQAATKTTQIARRQWQLGDISRLALFAAEQATAQSRSALAQAKASRLSDTAALFQALGGGWWNRQESFELNN